MASMVIRDDEAESARVTGQVMNAEPYLFGLFLLALAGVLGNRTAHQHNRSMNTRRWRNGS
jgi:hypothetical protein